VNAIRERMADYRVADDGGRPRRGTARARRARAEEPPERQLVALWLLGRVPAELLPWPLLRAGRAGRGPGPDVREASFLRSSGVPLSGDVEVHVRARDFVRHGHRHDAGYGGVVLHLVWEDDRPAGERGGPQPLPGGGFAPTVAVADALDGSVARLEALLRRGPSGAAAHGPPCAGARRRLGEEAVRELLRAEGRRRLAERTWRAARLVDRAGWRAAWRELLVRALRASAGRRRTPGPEPLADHVTAALTGRPIVGDGGGDALAVLRSLALEGRPGPLIGALRAGDDLGRQRAAEVGWNAVLPLLASLAAAYDDVALARATSRLAAAWPAPRPYGRTRALAELSGGSRAGDASYASRSGGALRAQGLLRVQELWCERGGCGQCPLSLGSVVT
jgi:hypothetical protein